MTINWPDQESVLNVLRTVAPLGALAMNKPVAPPEPPAFYGQVRCHHNTVWVWTSEHERMAVPGETCREIIKERATKRYYREMLRNLAGLTDAQLDHMEELLRKKYATATDEKEIS